jgi:hypothetical protein
MDSAEQERFVATVAANTVEDLGDDGHGIAQLAEGAQGVSFVRGDLSIHGSLRSLGGEWKSTGLTGHRFLAGNCRT